MKRKDASSEIESPQTWEPDRYARNARFVADLGMPVVELLAPQPGEHILDLGCGDGYLTFKLVALGCNVLGIDGSAAQVEAARERGVKAEVMDGSKLAFPSEFDAVFSNATLHWIKDADAAIAGVWNALKPGGRFVAECGGEGCVAEIRAALAKALARRGLHFEAFNPWYFPTAEAYAERLTKQGFQIESLRVFPRPTPLPGEMKAWLETFAESFTSPLLPSERSLFLSEVQELLRPRLCDTEGRWIADYTRLRFKVVKPEYLTPATPT
jgi:trans-aconitate methyltransferase